MLASRYQAGAQGLFQILVNAMTHGISKSGKRYPKGQIYDPPAADLCEFLTNAFPKLKESERKEHMELAKRLLELYSGKGKGKFSQSKITSAFSWMYQAGLIDYEQAWNPKGGYRFFIWRCGAKEQIEALFTRRPSFLNGEEMVPSECVPTPQLEHTSINTQAEIDEAEKIAVEDPQPKTAKKKCCDNPRIVKKKKSGRRLCRNCGTRFKKKKKKNGEDGHAPSIQSQSRKT